MSTEVRALRAGAPERDLPALLSRLDNWLAAKGGDQDLPEGGIPPGWVRDHKGRMVHESTIAETSRLEDQTVRGIVAHGVALAAQIGRFRGHSFEDIATFQDTLADEYKAKRKGGVKGNATFTSIDGRLKVVVQVQDRMTFGAELQVARDLIEECIQDWAKNANPEVRTLVQHAFTPDKEGQVSREKVFALRRIDIKDERWQRARQAITDSIRMTGTATYMRMYYRPRANAKWEPIPIDLAANWNDEGFAPPDGEPASAAGGAS